MAEINPELKGAIESLIFVSEKPIAIPEIQGVLEGLDPSTIEEAIKELIQEYESRGSGIKIIEIAGGYQMVSSPSYAQFIKKFYKIKHAERLSLPSLETLAIIAYKQPVSRMEIESIRGVNVDNVVKNLQEKALIRIIGRKEVPGRPFVYGTTRGFLEYFGLNSLDDLPNIEDFVATIQEMGSQISPVETEDLKADAQHNANLASEPAQENETATVTGKANTDMENNTEPQSPEPSTQTEKGDQ